MADIPPETVRLLQEYLQSVKQSPEDRMERIEGKLGEIRDRLVNAADWQTDHEKKDDDRHQELTRDFTDWRLSQERRVTALEADVEHLTKDVDTGQHNIAEIQRRANRLVSEPPRGLGKFLGSELAKHVARYSVWALLAALGYLAHLVQMLGK